MSVFLPQGQQNNINNQLTTRSLSVNPALISLNATNTSFSYFATPSVSGIGQNAYTVYIAGAPTGGILTASNYSLYVANGQTGLQNLTVNGQLKIPSGASNGYVLQSDATGNTSWVSSSSLTPSSLSLTGIGSSTISSSTLYVAPASTAFSGSSNYYFSYFNIPVSSGSTSGSASTVYIAGAPANATTSYALNVASGNIGMTGASSILYLANTTTSSSAITGTVQCSGGAHFKNLHVAGSSHVYSGVTASLVGALSTVDTSTVTVSNTSDMAFVSIQQPTLAATALQTTANAYTLYLAGAPVAGTNETITNSYALGVAGKTLLFGGTVIGSGGSTLNKVLTGTTTFTAPNIASTSSTSQSVSFSFSNIPVVTATLAPAVGANFNSVNMYIQSVSTTGFTIVIYNFGVSSTTGNTTVNWNAIG